MLLQAVNDFKAAQTSFPFPFYFNDVIIKFGGIRLSYFTVTMHREPSLQVWSYIC
jgi:hypothetical protein